MGVVGVLRVIESQLVGVGRHHRLLDRRRPTGGQGLRVLDDVDVEIVGLVLSCFGGHLHHGPLRRPGAVVGTDVDAGVLEVGIDVLVEVVLGRPPVRIAAVPGRRSAPTQPDRGAAVEHSGRQRDVAGASHRVALADQHRHQHEQPEHDERNPEKRLGDAWHGACSFPHQARSVTSASVGGAPRQLHTCNSLSTSTNSHMCHISNRIDRDQVHAARPARTSVAATEPFNSSTVSATRR